MYYSKFLDKDEMKEILSSKCLGVPLMKFNDKYYSVSEDIIGYLPNNLIIGCNGSNKINATILPYIDNIIKFNENFIVRDNDNIYEIFKDKLEEKTYKTIILNYDNPDISNKYNPLELVSEIYKKSQFKAIKVLKDITTYLFFNSNANEDPFWINSARDLFNGLAIYKIENNEELTIMSIYKLVQKLMEANSSKEFIESLDKESAVYINVVGTLLAPPETRNSILSIFNQVINKYLNGNSIINMLNKSDFNLQDILNKKVALFIKGDGDIAKTFNNLLVQELYNICEIWDNKNKLNVILPDFDTLYPIVNCSKIINDAKKMNMNFTITISSYMNLKTLYGLENTEIIKMCFENTIYLLTQDSQTLKDICYYCGNGEENKPLITPQELLRLKNNEAIVLMSRVYPMRVNFTPYQ